jgi:hypothetical protein
MTEKELSFVLPVTVLTSRILAAGTLRWPPTHEPTHGAETLAIHRRRTAYPFFNLIF